MSAPHDFAAVDELFAAFHEASSQPALAYGVVADGRLVHSGGLGELTVGGAPPTADSVFRIASMTKSFTAACLLGLRDEGALRLDDPVHRWVPELADLRGPTADSPTITVRDLLTMSAGLPTDDAWGDRQLPLSRAGFDALLHAGFSFAWAPGAAFEYSNLSYAILGRVIAAAAGVDYRRAVETRVLRPLQLDATVFDPGAVHAADLAAGYHRRDSGWTSVPFAAHGEFAAMGGLFSSVRDLARWTGEFTDAFPPRDDAPGDHVLSRATRREMQQVHRVEPSVVAPPGVAAGGSGSADGAPPGDADAPPGDADAPPGDAGAAPPPPGGYGFGLFVEHDPTLGLVVSHPGGLPGFGSAMRWHPDSGLAVVVLANATYAPVSELAARALNVLLGTPVARHPVAPWPATEKARAQVVSLLEHWDDALARAIFAPNVEQDEPLERRRAQVERLREQCGGLYPDPDRPLRVESPAAVAWSMRGTRGRVRVEMTLTPQRPPAIQTLELTLVSADDVSGEPA